MSLPFATLPSMVSAAILRSSVGSTRTRKRTYKRSGSETYSQATALVQHHLNACNSVMIAHPPQSQPLAFVAFGLENVRAAENQRDSGPSATCLPMPYRPSTRSWKSGGPSRTKHVFYMYMMFEVRCDHRKSSMPHGKTDQASII
jgi:hypothetical protein